MKLKLVKIKDLKLIDLVKIAAVVSLLLFLFSTFFFRSVRVIGSSMEPILKDGESGFSNVFAVTTGDVQRFDIVVIKEKDENQIVKRVVALPNETIQYKDDKLYINGEFLSEPFLDEEFVSKQTMHHQYEFTKDFGPFTLQEDEYFVLGDNRVISKDSRILGVFHKEDIVGKHVIVITPFNRMRIE